MANNREKHCYLALDPAKEEKEWGALERHLDLGASTKPGGSFGETYILPDGQELRLGAERFRAPELLFSPYLIGSEYKGVHQTVSDSIARVDMDLRASLYENIVLSGGSTLTRGFGDRLLSEIKNLVTRSNTKIRIFAPPERKYSTWIGGSILAGLSTFKKMWVSADEWQENPNIIHTRCL
jgi:centractin